MIILKNKKRRGQVLLIAVMLLATVITVVMTIAFNTTTETQVARLEADSQKALAAAEAGIDAVIKQSVNSGVLVNITDLNSGQFASQGITGNAQVKGEASPYFVSPLLQKDEQYTFYLSDYPGFGNPWSGNLHLYFVSETGCPSFEVTIIKADYSQERYVYNTCSSPDTINTETHPENKTLTSQITTVIDSTSFKYRTSTPILISGDFVAFIRVLGGRTKIGFQDVDLKVLPIQGKTVESEARTASGVVKKVQLFQSFPQIPSNFFMTSF